MAFKSKPPGSGAPAKGLSRKTPLKASAAMKGGKPLNAQKPLASKAGFKPRSPELPRPPSPQDEKKALQRRTIRALERARKAAADAGVTLSEWETDFIDDVTERVKTYGRAFADPDKGAINGTLSLRQGVKLREIRTKVKKAKPEDPNLADDDNETP